MIGSAQIATIELEVPIAARRDWVWACLTQQVGRWWPRDMLAAPASRSMQLEARAGGRLFEDAADGSAILWYTVAAIVTNRSLTLSGVVAPPFGGPCTSIVALTLDDAPDGGTTLRLRDDLIGTISDRQRAATPEGWRSILAGGLKPFAEAGRR